MCATINCKTHIIAIGVFIAASGISLIQCNWHGSHGSYPSANNIHHHHHHQHERYTTQNPVSSNGKFEEVYRWKQISYALLDSGRFDLWSIKYVLNSFVRGLSIGY